MWTNFTVQDRVDLFPCKYFHICETTPRRDPYRVLLCYVEFLSCMGRLAPRRGCAHLLYNF